MPSSWFIILLHVWTGTSSGLGQIVAESSFRTFICIVAFRSWIIFFMGLGRFDRTRKNWNRRENLGRFGIMFDIVIFGCLLVFAPFCATPSSQWKTLLAPLSHRIWDVLSLSPWNFWVPAISSSDRCASIWSPSKASDYMNAYLFVEVVEYLGWAEVGEYVAWEQKLEDLDGKMDTLKSQAKS